MNPLEFASKNIVFNEQSPIMGKFDIERYPFLRKPLMSLDDIRLRETIIMAASASLKTVFLQIDMAFRMACRPSSMLAVAQSDSDAKDWARTRVINFLHDLDAVRALLKKDRYAVTNDAMLFQSWFLIISGPGQNAQNSKQVRYLRTD